MTNDDMRAGWPCGHEEGIDRTTGTCLYETENGWRVSDCPGYSLEAFLSDVSALVEAGEQISYELQQGECVIEDRGDSIMHIPAIAPATNLGIDAALTPFLIPREDAS